MITYKAADLRKGDYREDRRNILENNSDILLRFNKPITRDFTVSAIAGAKLKQLYLENFSEVTLL